MISKRQLERLQLICKYNPEALDILKNVESGEDGCETCLEYNANGFCRILNGSVPEENRETGCEDWIQSEIPF